MPYYPFMYVLPDGTVLDAGANEQVVETWSLNLQTGSWTMIDPVIKDGHCSVMYRPGKILKTGTAADSGTTGNANSSAYVLDTTQPSPAWRRPTFGAPDLIQYGDSFTIQTPDAAWIASAALIRPGGVTHAFNEDQRYVPLTFTVSGNLTDGMTLEAWVRPSSGTGWRTVLLKEATSALSYALYSANNASPPGAWAHAATTEAFVLGTAAVPTNSWTHLAATYDGTTLKFFVNGVQVSSKPGVGPIAASSGALRVGGNGAWGEYFKGLIDDVRIYNRALSATEVQADMSTGVQ